MINHIKRHFYNGIDYIVNKEEKIVQLLPNFYQKLLNKKLWDNFGFKKIGGSSIGDVLLVDKFKSNFAAYCRMAWIGVPILDLKYVNAGTIIEPKVIKAIEKVTNKKVQTFKPEDYEFDYFKNKDDVVGGLPDGYIEEDNKILEIKTTNEKNFKKWIKFGIPAAYHKQAQLYSYLMNATHYSIVATFLKDEDYENPKKYPIEKRKIKNWNFKVNFLQAKDDIKKVKDWYYKFTSSNVSPKYDEMLDAELLEWLEPHNEKEWETLKNKWIKEGKIK